MEAQFTAELRVFDKQQGWVVSGHQGLHGWLRRNCQFSSGAGADRIRLGRQLEELHQTAAAFHEPGSASSISPAEDGWRGP
ncbi:MAG: hypothetical protein M3Y62_04395 [Candidatus Dormibacteraeota bacterium]|nr:hypothetical protein [Candidatus Dormibacteraeota bacterium]